MRAGHVAAATPHGLAGVLAGTGVPARAAVGVGGEPAVGPAAGAALARAARAAGAAPARANVVGPAAAVLIQGGRQEAGGRARPGQRLGVPRRHLERRCRPARPTRGLHPPLPPTRLPCPPPACPPPHPHPTLPQPGRCSVEAAEAVDVGPACAAAAATASTAKAARTQPRPRAMGPAEGQGGIQAAGEPTGGWFSGGRAFPDGHGRPVVGATTRGRRPCRTLRGALGPTHEPPKAGCRPEADSTRTRPAGVAPSGYEQAARAIRALALPGESQSCRGSGEKAVGQC